MNDFNDPDYDLLGGDATLYRAFVEYRLKHSVSRGEIVRLLIQKGFTHGQASILVDSVEAGMAVGKTRSNITFGLFCKTAAAGAVAVAVVLAVWIKFIPEEYRYAGFPLMGAAVGFAVALAGWNRRSNIFLAIAGVLAIVGCFLGVNHVCAPYDRNVLQALLHIIPTEPAVLSCFKVQLIYHHHIYWAIGGLVLALLISGQRRVRVTWL